MKGLYLPLRPVLLLFLILSTGTVNRAVSQQNIQMNKHDTLIMRLISENKQLFQGIAGRENELHIQVIYTQIDRDRKGRPVFTEHRYQAGPDRYYYPASTVKLPVAVLALQRLHELGIPELTRKSAMLTGSAGGKQTSVQTDSSAPGGKPSIEHYIKKILLVSDNDAFNRLYEFLGQAYINNSLHEKGYVNAEIIHRLESNLTEEENRFTNPVSFFDDKGNLLFEQPAQQSEYRYADRDCKMGKGFIKNGELINEPFDFSKKNRFTLDELQMLVRTIMFPESVPEKSRFNLTTDDYLFLRRYMSMMPQESVSPLYKQPDYWDTYVKFLFYGSEKGAAVPGIRIFNKVGDAYGFLIDGAYITDSTKGIEFMLSAVIYCNSDGIFNDDKYEYDETGLPFMKNLGRVIMEYERTRVRKHKPDLSQFAFHYTD